MRSAILLPVTLAAFVLSENAIFNTGWYAKILNPDSAAGRLGLVLFDERMRLRSDQPEVLGIGDSRMGFIPRFADQMKPPLRYKFATVAVPGTSPRCWYYMLREVDPQADRYAAIVIPVYDYDDEETWENTADRGADLHYLSPMLGWRDLIPFAGSYDDPALKYRAGLGILLKGTIFKADFQDLLVHRQARLEYAEKARRESAGWYYNFVGTDRNVAGVKVDWNAKTVDIPPDLPEAERANFQGLLFASPPPYSGRQSAYQKKWLGKIYDHYRGSRTRLIFFRLPRGPFVRTDPPPFNPNSSVRELANDPEVILDDEHDFDFLEKPEFFMDHQHLNGPGSAEFSRSLARRVQDLLEAHAF